MKISATDAKNGFGALLRSVQKNGIVSITKKDKKIAVILSTRVFKKMINIVSKTMQSEEGVCDNNNKITENKNI